MATRDQVSGRSCLAIILAAGEGKRMRSARPKVLHEVAGLSLLGHVLKSVAASGADGLGVVIGPNHDAAAAEARRFAPNADIFVQTERKGTAHAVLAARDMLAKGYDDVIVAYGDTPLVLPETYRRLRDVIAGGAAVAVLGFEAKDPTGYGRLLMQNGNLIAIREHKDAGADERRVTLCNGGIMALDGRRALELLSEISPNNAQQEYYLTDCVEIGLAKGLRSGTYVVPESEVMGVNDRVQLADCETLYQARRRAQAMRDGATLIAPETVFFAYDTEIGSDVTIEPNVVFGPGVKVADGAVIHAFSHLEGASVGASATVGPFARLRPGTQLGTKVKIGNFVETKAATIEAGAKVSHLSYIGDARVGEEANIGAGTITCNYDGYFKYFTDIGAQAFVGSNSALVAPVKIGRGAYVGSGSVITKDVPEDALAVGRGRQVAKPGWALSFHTRQAAAKAQSHKK